MYKKRLIFFCIALWLVGTTPLFAFGLSNDFGGTITASPQTTNAEATCEGTSFSISPSGYGTYPAGPYYSTDFSQTPTVGADVIGTYTEGLGPCCIPSADGCNPVTTYTVSMMSVAKSSGGNFVNNFNSSGGDITGMGTGGSSTGRVEDTGGTQPQTIAMAFGTIALKKGSSGQFVINLQKALNTSGANPPLVTDGSFGPKTEDAVKFFQYAHNLAVDGIVGNNTKTALLPFAPTIY